MREAPKPHKVPVAKIAGTVGVVLAVIAWPIGFIGYPLVCLSMLMAALLIAGLLIVWSV